MSADVVDPFWGVEKKNKLLLEIEITVRIDISVDDFRRLCSLKILYYSVQSYLWFFKTLLVFMPCKVCVVITYEKKKKKSYEDLWI